MTIAVYCSAKNNIAEEYKSLGRELGTWIVEQGHTLLYGGATGGLMTVVSDTVREKGGEVIGVVPQRIISSGRKADNCTELIEVANMAERKQRMREMADVFVCLPGSYGTLDEMMDVIASGTVGEHKKHIYIVNHNGFYAPLVEQIKQMKALGFIPAEESYRPRVVNTISELITAL